MPQQPASPASGAGRHPEALENALLAALRDGLPVGSVARLEALIATHVAPVPRAVIEVEKGLSRSHESDVASFRGSFIDFLRREFLPGLERAMLLASPIPRLSDDDESAAGALLNVVEAAELMVVLDRMLARRGITTEATVTFANAIIREVAAFGKALSRALDGSDPPDMRRLAREVGKLELLRWLLEILETKDHHRTLSTQLQVAARKALHRATAAIQRFLARRHADTRLETAAVTAEVEDLVTLVLVLVDAERESVAAEPDNAFFRELSREEIAAFGRQATALARVMFDELDALAARSSDAAALDRPLRQVMQLSAFARRLEVHVALPEIAGLRRLIARRLAALEARTGGRLPIVR
jgi:hypothetical protein